MIDLRKEIERYSKLNGYVSTSYQELMCSCGSSNFHLFSDDEEGGAYAVCHTCKEEIDVEKSRRYIEESINNICNCDNDVFTIGIGKAYYENSIDLRWVYLGCHCDMCGLDGVYVDWEEN